MANANITLRLDAALLREARILAVRQGTSLSRLLADRLEELVRLHNAYDVARRRAMARLRKGYRLEWTPRPRGALHER